MFHHAEFSNLELLIQKKIQKRYSISVVIPALNEADTIGTIVSYLNENFIKTTSLIDEVIVMDGNSCDGTSEISQDAGAIVYNIDEVMPKVKST
jgi:glucosyl-3-phosphoglycerate synthase